MTPLPTWQAADKAYQIHHAGCPTCRAASANPNTLQRCPEGEALWATYQAAGMNRCSVRHARDVMTLARVSRHKDLSLLLNVYYR